MKKSLFTTIGLTIGLGAFAQLPVSTTPSNKNVVLEELTGKTCQFCPDGHKKAAQIHAANPGRVMLLNIHTGGYAAGTPNYRTVWGDYVGGLFPVSGYPTGAVNRTNFGNTDGVMHSRSFWTANANTTLGQSSPVNVAGQATVDLDTRQLNLDVEAYYTSTGPGTSNKIHVVVTQNNIAGPQTGGATWNPAQMLPNGQYNHMHMVRYVFTPNAGDDIANITAGTTFSKSYSWTVPASINSIPVNLSDLEIAIYVSEGASTGTILSGNYSAIDFVTATPLGIANAAATMDASLGSVCGTTVDATMKITNMGNTPLSTADIEYVVNGGTPGVYQHTFSPALVTGQYEAVLIPAIPGLTPNGASSTINLAVTMLNGATNPGTNVSNGNTVVTAPTKTAATSTASFTVTTDQYGSETQWSLVNETTGTTVISGGPYTDAVQTYGPINATLINGNCYKFIMTDDYGDGICCSYGNGSYSLTAGATVLSSGGSFGASTGNKFVFDLQTSIDEVVLDKNVSIYPNPTTQSSTIAFNLTESTPVKMDVINTLGSTVFSTGLVTMSAGTQKLNFNGSKLPGGFYFINLTIGDELITRKVSLLK